MKVSTVLPVVALLTLVCLYGAAHTADAATITSGQALAKVCQDVDCTTFGQVNFKPTLNANTGVATAINITDTSISGNAWGSQIGWINFTPSGGGVSVNKTTGALSGFAYAAVGSWINFAPTGAGVTINSQGQFVGHAWVSGAYGGWLTFNCASAATCVTTNWRPTTEPTNSSSGGGSSSSRGSAAANGALVTTPVLIPATIPPVVPVGINGEPVSNPTTPNVPGTPGVGAGVASTNEATAADSFPQPTQAEIDALQAGGLESTTQFDPAVTDQAVEEITLNDRCFFCIVQYDEVATGRRLFAYGLVPEEFTFAIPVPFTDVDVDTTSLSLTALLGLFIRRSLLAARAYV